MALEDATGVLGTTQAVQALFQQYYLERGPVTTTSFSLAHPSRQRARIFRRLEVCLQLKYARGATKIIHDPDADT